MSEIQPITLVDLLLAALVMVALAAFCRPWSRKSASGLLTSMGRMALQLTLLGLVLQAIFDNVALHWVALVSVVMMLAAGHEITARQRWRGPRLREFRTGLISMVSGSFLLTLLALLVIIQHDPWYHPRYAIPFLGMMLGNTMTAIALSINRIQEGAHQQQARIEARLALGEPWHRAIHEIRRDGIHQGTLPVINMMAAAGIVSLPGMMTGQLVAGADPATAVSYQILIMILIAAGATLGILLATRMTVRQLFDDRERLRLDQYRKIE